MSLLKEVQASLAKRRDDWPRIAEATGVSLSWVEQNGRGVYRSRPIHDTVVAVHTWLQRNPGKKKRVR